MAEETNGKIPESLAPDDAARDRSIIEALLTAADEPVSGAKLAEMLSEGVGPKQVKDYVAELNEEYMATGRAFRIAEVAGGYQFAVHTEFAPWIRNLLDEKSPARLSQAALETLAIIAFKQPITKAEMEHIRGVNVDGVLRHLMEKGLVRISGRAEGVGRPLLYGTARDFLKFFGLNSLTDLPKLREIEELMKEEETLQSGLRSLGGEEGTARSNGGDDDGADEEEDDTVVDEATEVGEDEEVVDEVTELEDDDEEDDETYVDDEDDDGEDVTAAAEGDSADDTPEDGEGDERGTTEPLPGANGDRV